MSGTSADALDAALVDFADERQPRLLATHSQPLSHLRAEIHALAHPGPNEIQRLGRLSRQLAEISADAVHKLLEKAALRPADIAAIGSHGQTVRHEPPGQSLHPFTLQLGDPSTIAELTGITTVADFRCRDIAAGGHGAPLAPAFHQMVFSATTPRAVVNIGGMANITLLPDDTRVMGFDTGPGNCLMDYWAQKHLGKAFDQGGRWAASGQSQVGLLTRMLNDPYFRQPPPKSTGREYFNHYWLNERLRTAEALPAADIQATLLELTAHTILDAIREAVGNETPETLFVCGGGAHNPVLMRRLAHLGNLPVSSTGELGVDPQWVEAMAFAWLASRTLRGLPGNEPQVTGACRPVILGGVYPGDNSC